MDSAVNPADWGAQPAAPPSMSPADWGATPAAAPPEQKQPTKGFWDTLTAPGFLEETTPAVIGKRIGDVRQATQEFNRQGLWNKERAERIASGRSTNGMEDWKLAKINEMIEQSKPKQGPQPGMAEIFGAIKDQLQTDPGAFAAQAIRGIASAPELAFLPEALSLRMAEIAAKAGKVAETAVRTGTEAAQVGAVAAGESATRQLVEKGTTNPSQTAADTLMVAAPIVALKSGMAALKRGGKEVPQAKIEAETAAAIKDGASPTDAAIETLKKYGLEAQDAAKIKEAVAPAEPKGEADAAEKGTQQESGQQEHIGTEQQRLPAQAGDSNRAIEGGEVPKEKVVAPKVATPKVVDDRPKVPRVKAESVLLDAGMMPDEVADFLGKTTDVPPRKIDGALKKIFGDQKYVDQFLASRSQSGEVDPKLLIGLGLVGAGATAGFLFNKDPKDAMTGALMAGGAIAGAALLRKGVQGVSAVADHLRDTRYRITHLTDDYSGAIEAGRLANYRFTQFGKELIKNKAQREALTHYLQGDESVPLTPEMKGAADALQQYFDVMGKKGQAAGVLPEELLDNYITQLWTGLNKNDGIVRNMMKSLGLKNLAESPGMTPRTRFSMKRVIPSYAEGMAKGMIPTTLDAFDIARIYGDNINKAIANKNLINSLERERTPWGERVMVRDTPDAAVKQINQAAAMVDKNLEGGGEVGKQIRDFAISKAPADYVTIEHPQMRGYKVHKDIAPVMKNLFDAPPNAVTKAAYAVSVAAKRGLFSYSMFHVKSLADALAGTGMDAWVKVANGSAKEMLRHGQAGDAMDDLVRAGLKVVEKPLEGDVTPFSNALKLIEERHPVVGAPIKGMRLIGQAMDGFLWGTVHPTFKAATALAAYEKLLMRAPDKPKAELAKMAASYTNDIFGGLDWFRIADSVQNKFGRDLALAVTSPRGKQFMQIAMLAPDWTVATTRAMAKAIPGITQRETAALHQGYVVRSAILYASLAEALNLHFSGHHFWENEDPTMVDLGDGRRMQLSKHFMEPIHWLLKPGQQAMNKLGYVIKEPIEQALNKEYLSSKGAPPIQNRLTHAVGGALPITGQSAYNLGVVPALTGFFGFPIYGKTEEQAIDAAKERAATAGKNVSGAAAREKKRQERLKKKREEIGK